MINFDHDRAPVDAQDAAAAVAVGSDVLPAALPAAAAGAQPAEPTATSCFSLTCFLYSEEFIEQDVTYNYNYNYAPL
ncbi:MAG: hypothetical protein ACLP2F_09800 [Steroidobacteraceae bacterium]